MPDDGDAGRQDAVLDRMTDAFCALASEWRFTYLNEQGRRSSGISTTWSRTRTSRSTSRSSTSWRRAVRLSGRSTRRCRGTTTTSRSSSPWSPPTTLSRRTIRPRWTPPTANGRSSPEDGRPGGHPRTGTRSRGETGQPATRGSLLSRRARRSRRRGPRNLLVLRQRAAGGTVQRVGGDRCRDPPGVGLDFDAFAALGRLVDGVDGPLVDEAVFAVPLDWRARQQVVGEVLQ